MSPRKPKCSVLLNSPLLLSPTRPCVLLIPEVSKGVLGSKGSDLNRAGNMGSMNIKVRDFGSREQRAQVFGKNEKLGNHVILKKCYFSRRSKGAMIRCRGFVACENIQTNSLWILSQVQIMMARSLSEVNRFNNKEYLLI